MTPTKETMSCCIRCMRPVFTGETYYRTCRDAPLEQLPDPGLAPDLVNHPPHYQSPKGIESIDAIEAALTPEEFRGFCKGNALKYCWREKHKGGDQDLAKAAWYLNRLKKETP